MPTNIQIEDLKEFSTNIEENKTDYRTSLLKGAAIGIAFAGGISLLIHDWSHTTQAQLTEDSSRLVAAILAGGLTGMAISALWNIGKNLHSSFKSDYVESSKEELLNNSIEWNESNSLVNSQPNISYQTTDNYADTQTNSKTVFDSLPM